MNRDCQPWDRLIAAARLAPRDEETAAPYGFATRVAALAMSGDRPDYGAATRRLWLRAVGVAFLFALIAVAANYSAIASAFDDGQGVVLNLNPDDPVEEVVGLGSS